MKKLTVILIGLAVVAICSTAFAQTVLSDRELGDLYAGYQQQGGKDEAGLTVNDADGFNSGAIAVQSNIGAVYGSGTSINNCNTALIAYQAWMDIDVSIEEITVTKGGTVVTNGGSISSALDILTACAGSNIATKGGSICMLNMELSGQNQQHPR